MRQKLFYQPVFWMLWICGSGLQTIGSRLKMVGNRREGMVTNELSGSRQERESLRNTPVSQQQRPQVEGMSEQDSSSEVSKADVTTVSDYTT